MVDSDTHADVRIRKFGRNGDRNGDRNDDCIRIVMGLPACDVGCSKLENLVFSPIFHFAACCLILNSLAHIRFIFHIHTGEP